MNGNGIPQTIKSPLDGSEMRLTWNDEFDGDRINGKTWQLYDRMWAKNRVITTTDPRNFALENGEAVMRTYREDGHYTSHKSLTTFDRMSFQLSPSAAARSPRSGFSPHGSTAPWTT